jgi:uncharacterized RDD family membrane protein YckC
MGNTDNKSKQNEENNNDFSSELNDANHTHSAEEYNKKQEQFRQMLNNDNDNDNYSTNNINNSNYIWRVGFGRRLGAYLIDWVFVFLLILIAAVLTGIADELIEIMPTETNTADIMQTMQTLTDFSTHRFMPLYISVVFVYFSLEIFFSQSLGKMLLGIIIGTDDKKFASFSHLILRFCIKHCSYIFSLFFLITTISAFSTVGSIVSWIVIIGCFFALRESKQALYDQISHTAVYYKDELLQFKDNQRID